MNKILYSKGDAVSAFLESNRYQMFIHGANCQATMNSGIAKAVKHRMLDLYHADLDFHLTHKPVEKLGKVSYCEYKSEDSLPAHKMGFNLYTQLYYGTEKRHFNYGAFMSALKQAIDIAIRKNCIETNNALNNSINIVMPLIGCGLGGGDWEIVEELIKMYCFTEDHAVTFHVYMLAIP